MELQAVEEKIEMVVGRSQSLSWIEYLCMFIVVQVLLVIIYKLSSSSSSAVLTRTDSTKLKKNFCRMLSLHSLNSFRYRQDVYSSPKQD